MKISEVHPLSDFTLQIISEDGRIGIFDVNPYFKYDIFSLLKNEAEFIEIFNGSYFIEWSCGADLSADTIEANWQLRNM